MIIRFLNYIDSVTKHNNIPFKKLSKMSLNQYQFFKGVSIDSVAKQNNIPFMKLIIIECKLDNILDGYIDCNFIIVFSKEILNPQLCENLNFSKCGLS